LNLAVYAIAGLFLVVMAWFDQRDMEVEDVLVYGFLLGTAVWGFETVPDGYVLPFVEVGVVLIVASLLLDKLDLLGLADGYIFTGVFLLTASFSYLIVVILASTLMALEWYVLKAMFQIITRKDVSVTYKTRVAFIPFILYGFILAPILFPVLIQ
jgi:hypothetical protein